MPEPKKSSKKLDAPIENKSHRSKKSEKKERESQRSKRSKQKEPEADGGNQKLLEPVKKESSKKDVSVRSKRSAKQPEVEEKKASSRAPASQGIVVKSLGARKSERDKEASSVG